MGAAEGPMLDGMQASELFYDRPVPQLRSARDAAGGGMRQRLLDQTMSMQPYRSDPSAEGPLLDDMLAAELFKRAEVQRSAQEYEAQQRRALANQRLMGQIQSYGQELPPRYGQEPFQQGLGLPADDMRALLERQEMVRRMEAQGYTR